MLLNYFKNLALALIVLLAIIGAVFVLVSIIGAITVPM